MRGVVFWRVAAQCPVSTEVNPTDHTALVAVDQLQLARAAAPLKRVALTTQAHISRLVTEVCLSVVIGISREHILWIVTTLSTISAEIDTTDHAAGVTVNRLDLAHAVAPLQRISIAI